MTASPEFKGLVPVSVSTLCPTAFDFELYLRHNETNQPLLYRERNIPLEQEDLDRLLKNEVTTLYIPIAKSSEFCAYLRTNVLADQSRPATERYRILKEASRGVFVEALKGGNVEEIVGVTRDLGEQLVEVIWNNDCVVRDLFAVMAHDYYTYTHVTNVSTYCILLAERLGISDQKELTDIGQGGLLHDIGKRKIPASILDKPGKLTDEEHALVRKHPQFGFVELCQRDDIGWGLLAMVYQHHERLDGKGYPVGITDQDMHPWARICAIADVFDALTRDRPYRRGLITDEVLDYLEKLAGNAFDREMVHCWIDAINQQR